MIHSGPYILLYFGHASFSSLGPGNRAAESRYFLDSRKANRPKPAIFVDLGLLTVGTPPGMRNPSKVWKKRKHNIDSRSGNPSRFRV